MHKMIKSSGHSGRKTLKSRVIRFQGELPEPVFREIEALMYIANIRTKKEFLEWALALMKWVILAKSENEKIIIRSPNGSERELLLPFLFGPLEDMPLSLDALFKETKREANRENMITKDQ